jgi:hypothetical protein
MQERWLQGIRLQEPRTVHQGGEKSSLTSDKRG